MPPGTLTKGVGITTLMKMEVPGSHNASAKDYFQSWFKSQQKVMTVLKKKFFFLTPQERSCRTAQMSGLQQNIIWLESQILTIGGSAVRWCAPCPRQRLNGETCDHVSQMCGHASGGRLPGCCFQIWSQDLWANSQAGASHRASAKPQSQQTLKRLRGCLGGKTRALGQLFSLSTELKVDELSRLTCIFCH